MSPTKEEIKAWLKKFGRSREWLGRQCGDITKKTVDNWLSSPQEIPPGTLHLISRLMQDDAQAEQERLEREVPQLTHVVLRITTDELNEWSKAFKSSDAETFEEWALDAIRAAYEEEHKPESSNDDEDFTYPEIVPGDSPSEMVSNLKRRRSLEMGEQGQQNQLNRE